MPHKDREARRAYLREWKLTNRPAPVEEHQPDLALPPRGRIITSTDGTKVQCHVCGRWFRSLNTHIKTHGFNAQSYKEAYELPRTASLWPPALADKQREAALSRDQGAVGAAFLPATPGRPKGIVNRLGTRIEASEARRGLYTRGGAKTRREPDA